ncbi:MAG TPA: LemA family protein [Ohtaekwangia sp.]|nr:LemA family protein [Ohtaekwangia sp.]
MHKIYSSLIITLCGLALANCGKKQGDATLPSFTKADSVTEMYLALQDSMLQTWNVMINDDNQKLKAMHNLLHELSITHPQEAEKFEIFEQRLDQLARSRYTQKSMSNTDVVEEYDFASNALVVELIADAESKPQFAYNTTLQRLVDQILRAERRINNYRMEYDNIVYTYNEFIDQNKNYLTEADQTLEKKPVFEMVSE